MGYKIHVAEVYQVTHRAFDCFSNKQDVINRLLYEECSDLSWLGEDIDSSEHLEVYRFDLANLIAKMVYNRREFEIWREKNQIEESLDTIIGTIAKWMALADPRNDYVVLTWY